MKRNAEGGGNWKEAIDLKACAEYCLPSSAPHAVTPFLVWVVIGVVVPLWCANLACGCGERVGSLSCWLSSWLLPNSVSRKCPASKC